MNFMIGNVTGHDEMIGLRDYGDARANHRHEPHHPLGVEGKIIVLVNYYLRVGMIFNS